MVLLDLLYPFAGPCALCGYHDKRHRLADAVIGGVWAGDSVESTAEDYGVSADAINALVAYAERRRQQHKARWT